MGQIFTDLSYNNKTLKPIGRPINDIKALYKEKNANYNYVLDNKNKTETALNSIPTTGHEKDKELVANAKNKFKETFDSFGEALEDKVIDTKQLITDINNNYGLTEVQRMAKVQSDYENGLRKRFEEGKITSKQMNRAIAYSRNNYKGIEQDPETGIFTGSFSGRQVGDYIDVSKEVADVLKGFKANEVPLHINGQRIVADPTGQGYYIAGTTKSVSETDLVKAAKSYVGSNDKIQDQFDDEIFYDLQNKDIGTNEIKQLLPFVSQNVREMFGVTDQASFNSLDASKIENILKEKGISLNDAYATLKKDQLTNEAIELGVGKESYTEYKQKFIKPLNIDSNGNDINYDIEKGLMTVGKIFTNQRISPTDYTNIKQGKEATKNTLVTAKNRLRELQNKRDSGEPISPNAIESLKQSIAIGNRDLQDFERQENSIKNFVLNKTKKNVALQNYYNQYRNNLMKQRADKFNELVNYYESESKDYQAIANAGQEFTLPNGLKGGLSVADRNTAINEMLDKEFNPKSYKDFENEAIFKYSQQDTSNLLGINAATDFDNATRFVANKIKNSIGGELEEQNITRDVFGFFTDSLSNTTNTKYKEFENIMSGIFAETPEQFTFKGKGLEALIEDELDVDIDDVDMSKATIKPVIEFIDGKPAYVVSIKGVKKDGKIPDLGKIIVNYEGSAVGHTELINQVVSEQAKKYAAKFANTPLQGEDLTNYRKLAKSYINTTPAGKELDRLNIYTAEVGEPLNWQITPNRSINIVPMKVGENFGENEFYLQNKNGFYLGKDKYGNKGFYSKDTEGVQLDSFSGADELKEVIGSELLKENLTKTNTATVNNATFTNNTPINFNKLIAVESANNPNAISPKGAIGLAQIMPQGSTGGSPLDDYNSDNKTSYTNKDLTNPEISKEVGKWYLDTKIPELLTTYSLPNTSAYKLMAYNWGIGNLKEWYENGANPNDIPQETQNYITKILSTN